MGKKKRKKRGMIARIREAERKSAQRYYKVFKSLDNPGDVGKLRVLGVNRTAVSEIVSAKARERRRKAERNAILFAKRHAPETVRTLRLIIKNGSNREESICQLAKIGMTTQDGNTSATASR